METAIEKKPASRLCPNLCLVVPCYNEANVLPVMLSVFQSKLQTLIKDGKVGADSVVLFVNDGSNDQTWPLICKASRESCLVKGISLSRNRGHQNALAAGLMEARAFCDAAVSIDCDGQDDIDAIDAMIEAYEKGAEIVYGVRSGRATDTWFKRTTAQGFYRLMSWLGADCVYNHADYRLVGRAALEAFSEFHEVNLFLRGLFPLIGFKSEVVAYERSPRKAGESHYPLRKMAAFAFDGITSFSVRPIRLVTLLGGVVSLGSLAGIIYAVSSVIFGHAVSGWASMMCIVCLLGGVQLLSIGVIGEYIGKIYLETKGRPRYIIAERTWDFEDGRGGEGTYDNSRRI